jgi:DNA polymerase-3 subunit epsilon
MKYAIIDIETTGPNASSDKIIEIAIIVHDGDQIVNQFSSLVNPECIIPPFISRLTGIDNEMVADAPKFYEVAKRIVEITNDTVFVAHNATFDYNFIRHEFKSLGFNFSKDFLCTLRLAKKLLPGLPAYGLGRLNGFLNLQIENRHRAFGDAEATVKLFEILIEKNTGSADFSEFLQNDYINYRYPPGFDKSIVENLPESCGVYYMHDEQGTIIYIGKSKNIRSRVMTHFSNKQSKKAVALRNSIHSITFELTGNELVALLLESDEIKKWQPQFNSAQRRTYTNYGIYLSQDENGYFNLSTSLQNDDDEDQAIVVASSLNHATQIIGRLIDRFTLCQKLCEQDIHGKCFNYTVRLCNGACEGLETADVYNKRVIRAVKSLKFKHQNFMIIGNGRSTEEKSVIHVERGKYRGFGYFTPEFTVASPASLIDFVVERQDNRDIQRILRQSVRKVPGQNLITW